MRVGGGNSKEGGTAIGVVSGAEADPPWSGHMGRAGAQVYGPSWEVPVCCSRAPEDYALLAKYDRSLMNFPEAKSWLTQGHRLASDNHTNSF